MCTLAWGRKDGQLWACFNRDELRSRPDADLPEMVVEGNERMIFARDPVGHGSWFVVTEGGYVVALLNHYPDGPEIRTAPHRSRGRLVLDMARASATEDIALILEPGYLGAHAPFHLVILHAEKELLYTWDGSHLQQVTCPQQLRTTSSYQQDTVVSWREQWWAGVSAGREMDEVIAGELLRQLHPAHPAWGTTMDREDARTVSQIELRNDPEGCTFVYRKRDPEGIGFLAPKRVRMRG